MTLCRLVDQKTNGVFFMHGERLLGDLKELFENGDVKKALDSSIFHVDAVGLLHKKNEAVILPKPRTT